MEQNDQSIFVGIDDYFLAMELLERANPSAHTFFKRALHTLDNAKVLEFLTDVTFGVSPQSVHYSKTTQNREMNVSLSLDWDMGMTILVEKRRAFVNNTKEKITIYPVNDEALKDGFTFATIANNTTYYPRGIQGHTRYVAKQGKDGEIEISSFNQHGLPVEKEQEISF